MEVGLVVTALFLLVAWGVVRASRNRAFQRAAVEHHDDASRVRVDRLW
jgi:hypothetical protein